jgi:phosphoribosylaminoimidazolecarboxamide formyltransferase/IMP cyclohydrolase
MEEKLVRVKTAILSVADKSGLVSFARELDARGIKLMATGGTHAELKQAGVPVRSLQDDMKLPQALSGRVKTLHSPLFGAILAKRTPEHLEELSRMGVEPIDMVVVNFYPFEKVSGDSNADQELLIENIDIGGPSLVRAASKNLEYVTVVPSPSLYGQVIDELKEHDGSTSLGLRRRLAPEEVRGAGRVPAEVPPHRLEVPGRQVRREPGPAGDDLLDRRLPDHDRLAAAGGGEAVLQQLPRHRVGIRHTGGFRGNTRRGNRQAREHQRVRLRAHAI